MLIDTPIFINLGNHEGFPINQFGGPEFNTDDWLLKSTASMWSHWIDSELTVKDNIKPSAIMNYGGFYTTLARPGLRIIALHTGYMQDQNFYLSWLNETRDMASQLHWLDNILSQATKLNESVYIIQHIPINGFDSKQQHPYYNVFRNHKSVIKAVFNGHTHCDEFHLLGSYTSDISQLQEPWAVEYNPGTLWFTLHSLLFQSHFLSQ